MHALKLSKTYSALKFFKLHKYQVVSNGSKINNSENSKTTELLHSIYCFKKFPKRKSFEKLIFF